MAVIYPNETAVIYFNETPNLLELENPRGVQPSRPEISKRLSRTIKEAANRLTRLRVNKEPQAKKKGITYQRALASTAKAEIKGL